MSLRWLNSSQCCATRKMLAWYRQCVHACLFLSSIFTCSCVIWMCVLLFNLLCIDPLLRFTIATHNFTFIYLLLRPQFPDAPRQLSIWGKPMKREAVSRVFHSNPQHESFLKATRLQGLPCYYQHSLSTKHNLPQTKSEKWTAHLVTEKQ